MTERFVRIAGWGKYLPERIMPNAELAAAIVRAVAAYLRRKNATVSAFYVSNVEQYLRLERVWGSFCGNAARLPVDDASVFIRAGRGGRYSRGTALTAELSPIGVEADGCDRRP